MEGAAGQAPCPSALGAPGGALYIGGLGVSGPLMQRDGTNPRVLGSGSLSPLEGRMVSDTGTASRDAAATPSPCICSRGYGEMLLGVGNTPSLDQAWGRNCEP